MNFCLRSISRSVIIFVFLYAGTIYAVDCNCGDFCGSCGSNTPKYLLAVLTNLKGCPADFHQGASQVYPCFDGKTMDVVLKQDTINQCGYCWYGPAFTVEDCPFQFRLGFYINLSAPDNETTFSVILQEDCGGWYDLSWLTTSASSSCKITGSASYSSYCAGPFPGIESGIVSWAPLVLSDGNCAGCGDVNEIPENCGQLSCATLDEYSKISGSSAQYYGPFMIYSPSKCQTHAKSGNAIQTAKIVCPDAQLVSATASSSSPADIIVVPQNISCSPGNSAGFAIYALRGKGIVTLNAKFYQKAFSDQCIVKETIKTVTILVQPDPGDECCTDQYKPVLLEGSPGNVSTPIRAGTNPLDEWPEAAIYRSGDFEDVEVIIPGRFTPVIFNNGKAPEYMRGWKSRISESNAVVITNPESIKYIYEPNTNYRIHTVQNSLGRNIVEFIYDGNGLPLRQNDLIDANLYISYHYTGDVLTEIREHSGGYCRPYPLEYDNEKISFVSGQCSNCSPNGGRRYFYNTGGTLKYEKSISDEILFEYEFDSQQRLTGKWAGDRQLNHPVQIVTYYDDPNGYTADLKEYADDTNFCSIREYYNNAGMLIRRTTCEVLNENIDPRRQNIYAGKHLRYQRINR